MYRAQGTWSIGNQGHRVEWFNLNMCSRFRAQGQLEALFMGSRVEGLRVQSQEVQGSKDLGVTLQVEVSGLQGSRVHCCRVKKVQGSGIIRGSD